MSSKQTHDGAGVMETHQHANVMCDSFVFTCSQRLRMWNLQHQIELHRNQCIEFGVLQSSVDFMLWTCSCEAAPRCKRTLKPGVRVLRAAVWWDRTGSSSPSHPVHCCRTLECTDPPFHRDRPSLPWRSDGVKQDGTWTAEPGSPARSGSSPGAAGRWRRGWCHCEGRPFCWWGSRSRTDSAASSGPGPAEPGNDCSGSGSGWCWTRSWRGIWCRGEEEHTV